MSKWVTVLTVSLPQQMWVIRTRLEDEGIECFAKDELTIQSDNLYSAALGGVKLQVKEEDAARAVEILKEAGYLRDEPERPDLLSRLDIATSGLPVLKSLDVRYRVIIITVILAAVASTVLYFIIAPTSIELLTSDAWCVDRVDFNGKTVGPNTVERLAVRLTDMDGNGPCTERMSFYNAHTLELPGINSGRVNGYWRLDDNDNLVIGTDSSKDVYAGTYTIDISKKGLIISSKNTKIYAHKDNFSFNNPFR